MPLGQTFLDTTNLLFSLWGQALTLQYLSTKPLADSVQQSLADQMNEVLCPIPGQSVAIRGPRSLILTKQTSVHVMGLGAHESKVLWSKVETAKWPLATKPPLECLRGYKLTVWRSLVL